jgi:hypothetical protein
MPLDFLQKLRQRPGSYCLPLPWLLTAPLLCCCVDPCHEGVPAAAGCSSRSQHAGAWRSAASLVSPQRVPHLPSAAAGLSGRGPPPAGVQRAVQQRQAVARGAPAHHGQQRRWVGCECQGCQGLVQGSARMMLACGYSRCTLICCGFRCCRQQSCCTQDSAATSRSACEPCTVAWPCCLLRHSRSLNLDLPPPSRCPHLHMHRPAPAAQPGPGCGSHHAHAGSY